MVLFFGIFGFLTLINVLLLVFSTSLRWNPPVEKKQASRSEAPGARVYAIGSLDSKYQEAV